MNDKTCLYICYYDEWTDEMEGDLVIPETQTLIKWPLFSSATKEQCLIKKDWHEEWDNHIINPFNEEGARNYFANKGFKNIIFITKVFQSDNNKFTNQLTKGEK